MSAIDFQQGELKDFVEGPLHERNGFASTAPAIRYKKIYGKKLFSGWPGFPLWAVDTWTNSGPNYPDLSGELNAITSACIEAGEIFPSTQNFHAHTRYLHFKTEWSRPQYTLDGENALTISAQEITFEAWADQQSGMLYRYKLTSNYNGGTDFDVTFYDDGTYDATGTTPPDIQSVWTAVGAFTGWPADYVDQQAETAVVDTTHYTRTRTARWENYNVSPSTFHTVTETLKCTLDTAYTLADCVTDSETLANTYDFTNPWDAIIIPTGTVNHVLPLGQQWEFRYEGYQPPFPSTWASDYGTGQTAEDYIAEIEELLTGWEVKIYETPIPVDGRPISIEIIPAGAEGRVVGYEYFGTTTTNPVIWYTRVRVENGKSVDLDINRTKWEVFFEADTLPDPWDYSFQIGTNTLISDPLTTSDDTAYFLGPSTFESTPSTDLEPFDYGQATITEPS